MSILRAFPREAAKLFMKKQLVVTENTSLEPLVTSALPVTSDVVGDIRDIIARARKSVVRHVNTVQVLANWLIGRRIVVEEQKGQRATYGEHLLAKISRELTLDFGRGFAEPQLRNCRLFYKAFPEEKQIRYTLCIKLGWSHWRLLMRVADPKAREFYINEAATRDLSVRQLAREIETQSYRRVMANQLESVDAASQIPAETTPAMLIKDPCVAEFLNLPGPVKGKEKKVEKRILDTIEKFLLELGRGFALVGRQYRIPFDDTEKKVDFVFYNIFLRCYVLVDLKTSKLNSRDIGQMDAYRRIFDGLKRGKDDQPTIGILLGTEIRETDVKYSIMSECDRMLAVKLLPYMPTKEELIAEIEYARGRTSTRKTLIRKKSLHKKN